MCFIPCHTNPIYLLSTSPRVDPVTWVVVVLVLNGLPTVTRAHLKKKKNNTSQRWIIWFCINLSYFYIFFYLPISPEGFCHCLHQALSKVKWCPIFFPVTAPQDMNSCWRCNYLLRPYMAEKKNIKIFSKYRAVLLHNAAWFVKSNFISYIITKWKKGRKGKTCQVPHFSKCKIIRWGVKRDLI